MSTVPVVWAADVRVPKRDIAAARDAVQTCRAADAGRTGLGAAGALRASPRVHVDALRGSRRRRRGGSRRRRPECDITLHGATEFDQVGVSGRLARESTAAAALSTGTPLLTRSASTASGT